MTMENKKATTLQQRFGFSDPELKTPKHDELMIWLDENCQEVYRRLMREENRRERNELHCGWEFPITEAKYGSKYTIGFADMRMTPYRATVDQVILFEVKPSIPSAGELLRQINLYRTYTPQSRWAVVSPDTRFRSVIEGQGIGFVDPAEW
jgi:hypothetical protein